MLTLFTVPKPFRGHIGDIQRNAIDSWRALHPDVQIVLVGDEEGVGRAAYAAGVEHVGGLATNERGTPRLDSAFALVEAVASQPLWCMVNADVVLLDDFLPAVQRVTRAFERFLLVGECRDLPVPADLRLEGAAVRAELRRRALSEGRLRGYAALDYFVFPAGEFGPIPPFLIGRACFDNWLVWRVRSIGDSVVDATRTVVAIHQSHDYSHVAGGLEEAYYGDEARHNEYLAGGREHIYTLHDATHRLYRLGPPLRYVGSVFRVREKARVARARVEARLKMRRARQRLHRPHRVLGVFAEPRPGTTVLLDELAQADGVELTVLYGKRPAAGDGSADALNHTHWFPRSVPLPGARRLLGRDYDVNWAICNSFYGLQPECMVVSGLHSFAAQAAVAWCVARRIPYVLVDEGAQLGNSAGWRKTLTKSMLRKAAGVVVTSPPAGRAAGTGSSSVGLLLGVVERSVARRSAQRAGSMSRRAQGIFRV